MYGLLSICIEVLLRPACELAARLNRDERGVVASAELVAGLPIFLLFWVLMWEFGVLQSAKLALAGEARTAAFMQAYTEACIAPANHQQAMTRKSAFYQPQCSQKGWGEADTFWREMDKAGGEDLTRDVKKARAPMIIQARLRADFRFHRELDWELYSMSNRVSVMEPVRYTYEDGAIKAGYDKVLKERVSRHGSLIALFPNVFRSAQ